MAIEIEKSFTVEAAADAVWAFLIDPYAVARCLPGAAITEQVDDRTYAGKITIKVGPVSSSYKGKIVFERLDPETRTAVLSGRGQDVRGRGGADMKMTSTLVERDGGTEVTVVSQVSVTGILAQFGRGMIQDVSDHMFQTFTEKMRAELAASNTGIPAVPSAPSAPSDSDAALEVVSLGAKVGGRVAARMIRRPAFWVVVLISLLLYLIVR